MQAVSSAPFQATPARVAHAREDPARPKAFERLIDAATLSSIRPADAAVGVRLTGVLEGVGTSR